VIFRSHQGGRGCGYHDYENEDDDEDVESDNHAFVIGTRLQIDF
jgi:hypothetical protein